MIVLGALKSIIVLHLSFLSVCCLVVVVVVGTCWDLLGLYLLGGLSGLCDVCKYVGIYDGGYV
jgi:hypothetical protein